MGITSRLTCSAPFSSRSQTPSLRTGRAQLAGLRDQRPQFELEAAPRQLDEVQAGLAGGVLQE